MGVIYIVSFHAVINVWTTVGRHNNKRDKSGKNSDLDGDRSPEPLSFQPKTLAEKCAKAQLQKEQNRALTTSFPETSFHQNSHPQQFHSVNFYHLNSVSSKYFSIPQNQSEHTVYHAQRSTVCNEDLKTTIRSANESFTASRRRRVDKKKIFHLRRSLILNSYTSEVIGDKKCSNRYCMVSKGSLTDQGNRSCSTLV